MRQKTTTSIQKKMMRLILLICGTVLFVACASFFVYEFLTYRNITRRELTTLAEITASNVTSSMLFKNETDASDILAALKAQQHIVAAILYDKDGHVFASYPNRTEPGYQPRRINDSNFVFRESSLEGFTPVTLNGKRIGTFYLRSDMKAVYNRFSVYSGIAALFFLFAFLLTYILSRRMQRTVTQPILQLTDKARLVSEKKDYSVRAEKKSDDELGVLTDAFNQMLAQIQAQNAEIKKLNANLEEKISIRTWELQEANNALTEQNEFIETIIDASIDLIAVFDQDLNYLIINKYAADVFKKTREEMIGKNLLTVFPHLADQPIVKHLHRALSGEFVHVEAYHSQVSEAYFENFFIPLHDQDNNVDRVLLIGHDITSVMEANEKLRQLNAELEKSNRDLEQFAYVASHDLQEPLRKIMTFADLSEKNTQNPEIQKRYLQKIYSSAGRMTELIRAVLNYSRLSRAGSGFEEVDLNAVVDQIKTDLELAMEEKGAVVVIDDLPSVKGIPLQLNQLFLNLFTNSLKFADKKPEISIRALPLSQEDRSLHPSLQTETDYVKIVFSDNGIGFEQQYADRIFSIFQRLHSSDRFAGTGIGLALCKKIVENHHGYISVQSEPGVGTSFFIYLPIEKNNSENVSAQRKKADTAAGKTLTP